MLVRDGARVVERGLRSLLGFADEVVLVDSASTDGTAAVAEDFCGKNGLAFQCVTLSPTSHPDLFLLDEPSTWRRPVPGPFTGLHVLKRFDLARNLGLDACRGKYIFKLDADDELVDARGVAHLVEVFEQCPWLDLGMHPYRSVAGQGSALAYLNLFWRNKPEVRFTQAIHEWHLGGHEVDVRTPTGVARVPNHAATRRGLVLDHRDNKGEGTRIPHRNYKVILAEYERRLAAGEPLDSDFIDAVVGDVAEVDPDLAREMRRKAA
jgi:glycosyltransferase involved in cell wall biosynthesis